MQTRLTMPALATVLGCGLATAVSINMMMVGYVQAQATEVTPEAIAQTRVGAGASPTSPNTNITEDEISSFGCVIGGISMVGAAYWAGPSEAIMLWGGGLLTPSGSGVLAASIIGGLGAAGCSIGATIAPTAVWTYQQMLHRPEAVGKQDYSSTYSALAAVQP